ncbi:Zn(2)-Cys(6) zinc finger domain protein [Podospora conica]|nr:Zn(2)-Cys(6) zinc finger domain protein [Schizothecium conicum]
MPMPGPRSRQGCDECRKRRRKCDEQKPRCGHCITFARRCEYPLRVVWQDGKKSSISGTQETGNNQVASPDRANPQTKGPPRTLPNGIPLSPRYQRLLAHFTRDILASLSCHPSIHHDLGQGLVPAALESPQLMSACLALSAAGFLSRGVLEIDGLEVTKVLGHLQSSGLALLRSALATTSSPTAGVQRQMSDTLLATCLIWCLTDVFTYRRSEDTVLPSWRIHLQGMRAILDRDSHHTRNFAPGTATSTQMAMKHLHQLYLSLQTLPYINPATSGRTPVTSHVPQTHLAVTTSPAIDGFLGYSDELLDIMHQIDLLSRTFPPPSPFEADVLLGKVQAMIARDAIAAPPIMLSPSSSARDESAEFTLCHQIFQQATLIQLYRRLYHLPSASPQIQNAVTTMEIMFECLEVSSTKARPGAPRDDAGGESMWVAMAMPVFTLGCEAFTPEQQQFVLSKMDRLEACIQSLHIKIIRSALVDVWALRKEIGDDGVGALCAGNLLEKLTYDIILF